MFPLWDTEEYWLLDVQCLSLAHAAPQHRRPGTIYPGQQERLHFFW